MFMDMVIDGDRTFIVIGLNHVVLLTELYKNSAK